MTTIADATDVNKIVAANLQAALSRAGEDAASNAIAAFDSPEHARRVLSGEATAYVYELMGAAQAMHISAADLLEGVRG